MVGITRRKVFFFGPPSIKKGSGWFGFRRSREDLEWLVNVLRARSFWAGFHVEISGSCYDRMPQPEMVRECHCDRFLDSCLSLNLLVAMCRLGRKDAERKRVLREKNERLQERINMYESYRKRYLLQVPGRSRGSEFSH